MNKIFFQLSFVSLILFLLYDLYKIRKYIKIKKKGDLIATLIMLGFVFFYTTVYAHDLLTMMIGGFSKIINPVVGYLIVMVSFYGGYYVAKRSFERHLRVNRKKLSKDVRGAMPIFAHYLIFLVSATFFLLATATAVLIFMYFIDKMGGS